jgi:hypothetical protein
MARDAAGAMRQARCRSIVTGTDPRARVDAARLARTFRIMISLSLHRKAGDCARLLLLLCAVGACDRPNTVTISGDVPGLDTLASLGDSLLARAARGEVGLIDPDTVANGATGVRPTGVRANGIRVDTSANGGSRAGELATTVGQAISIRAQASRDSMARDIAVRLAGSDLAVRTRADSVRGVVTLVGAAPTRQVVLRVAGNDVSVSGMATSGLGRLAGTEVMVRGVKVTPRDIVVSDYLVRASDGVPAWDGTLDEGGGLRLTDGSGYKLLPSVPAALRSMVGARVWVAFTPGSATVDSYGLIRRR